MKIYSWIDGLGEKNNYWRITADWQCSYQYATRRRTYGYCWVQYQQSQHAIMIYWIHHQITPAFVHLLSRGALLPTICCHVGLSGHSCLGTTLVQSQVYNILFANFVYCQFPSFSALSLIPTSRQERFLPVRSATSLIHLAVNILS